jgi:hypothetical protein
VSPVRYGLYLCVPYGSHNQQRLFPHTALTGCTTRLLQHYPSATALPVCYSTTRLLQHYPSAAALLACRRTTRLLPHYPLATALPVCYCTTRLLLHYPSATALPVCCRTTRLLPHYPSATALPVCYCTTHSLPPLSPVRGFRHSKIGICYSAVWHSMSQSIESRSFRSAGFQNG